MTYQMEWVALHWKDFLSWCEAEFICRTIVSRRDAGPLEWRSVMTRFTLADMIYRARQIQAPLASQALIARYNRRRKWAQWMAEIDRIETHRLKRHKSYVLAANRYRGPDRITTSSIHSM